MTVAFTGAMSGFRSMEARNSVTSRIRLENSSALAAYGGSSASSSPYSFSVEPHPAALEMMASWNLRELPRELPRLAVKLLQIAGANDRTIPSEDAKRIQRLLPGTHTVILSGLGHLAHEESPAEHARLIIEAAAG